MPLTTREADVLHDIVKLHEGRGGVVVHSTMARAEREAVQSLTLKGLVELRRTRKDTPDDRRIVVPTAHARRLVANQSRVDP